MCIDLSISGERRLPLEHEQALFRIVQEALANVARHSGARAAQVALCCDADQVDLTVSDKVMVSIARHRAALARSA